MNDVGSNLKVPVGTTSIAGYGATIIGIIGTVLVAVFDVDQEQAAVIAGAVFTIVSFAVTQIGRYIQARELARSSWGARSVAAAYERDEEEGCTNPFDGDEPNG